MNKLVFISGPYSANTLLGSEANIQVAREAALWCVEHRIFYFCPHLNSLFFEQWSPDTPVSFYYAMGEEILSRCDAMLVLDGWQQSKGALLEIEYANAHNIPFFYDHVSLLNWHREEKP